MCQNYDKNSAMCSRCENRKPKQYQLCHCSTRAKEIYKKAEEIFKRPLFSSDGLDPSTLGKAPSFNIAEDHPSLGGELDELSGNINHRLGYVPGLDSVEAFEEDTNEMAGIDGRSRSYVG